MSYPYAFWLRDSPSITSSRKRTADPSIVTPASSQEMPAIQRRRRSYGGLRPRGRKMVQRVPRAIRTRGTPDGYYEIPQNILLRLYFNTSTGIFVTDQATGAPVGATGYKGMGFRFTDDECILHFGDNGAISTTSTITIPNATELNSVFDECKTARVHMQYWVANQTPGGHTTTGYDPEFWAVVDTNDAFPPGQDIIQGYAKNTRILTDRVTNMQYVPALQVDAAADAGSGASTAAGLSVNGYIRTGSNATILGSKLYYWLPYTSTSTFVGYLNIKIVLVRRYKRTR